MRKYMRPDIFAFSIVGKRELEKFLEKPFFIVTAIMGFTCS